MKSCTLFQYFFPTQTEGAPTSYFPLILLLPPISSQYPPSMYTNPPTLTCAVYLAAYGRLVCGQEDGSIAVLSATQAATVLMLQPRKFCRG